MRITAEIRKVLRLRSGYKCEFCETSETDSGGELTIDHFHPKSKGGNDSLDNLVYCCFRCNQYKSDYWPETPDKPMLWNPRSEKREKHFLSLEDGRLYPLTSKAVFTLRRLRLNRPSLIAKRFKIAKENENIQLMMQYSNLLLLLEQILQQQRESMERQQQLLKEQQEMLYLLSQK